MNWPEDFINKVICGDCLPVLRGIPDKSIDLVLTDPPYGIKMDKGFEGFGGFGAPIARRRYEEDDWDSHRPSKEYFNELIRASDRAIVFGGNFFADLLPIGTHWLVWDKLNTMPTFGDCELIWTNINRKSIKKYTHEYNGLIGKEAWRDHPTQKPLALFEWILGKYSKEGELILDPFLGSGTTAVACKKTKRNFIGIDINEKYCKITEDRLRQGVL